MEDNDRYLLGSPNGEYFGGFTKKDKQPIMTFSRMDAKVFTNMDEAMKMRKYLRDVCCITLNEGLILV